MPVTTQCPIRRLSQQEFAEIAYDVMHHVFAIHNEIGRFFDETIYKRALAQRMHGVRLEEPIEITFGSFRKTLYLDVLVGNGAIFEFKAVTALAGAHRSQLLQYLMLVEAAHGKLINVRAADVEHEFVNTSWEHADRSRFTVQTRRLNTTVPGVVQLHDFLLGFLRDLGTGLGISLYEEAVMHCFGGKEQVEVDVGVVVDGCQVGNQRMRLIAPGVALKITAFDADLELFELHARRLLSHADLRAIAWVNIGLKTVIFTTIER